MTEKPEPTAYEEGRRMALQAIQRRVKSGKDPLMLYPSERTFSKWAGETWGEFQRGYIEAVKEWKKNNA